MARIPESEVYRLKTSTSLVRLVEASGVSLVKTGKDYRGLCPFHDDKEPSLVVSPDKNLWNCLGACREGGDVIAWVMKAEGISFRHACELLQNNYEPSGKIAKGHKHPAVTKSTVPKLDVLFDEQDVPRETDEALLARIVNYYHETLKQSPEALAYLKRRGLAHPELIETFKLGYANRTLGYRLPAKTRVLGRDLRARLVEIGIYRDSGHEHLTGSLIVPVFDKHGQVVEVYGRKLLDNLRAGTPKHLYLPGPHKGVFNLKALQASEEIILCESFIDAMSFWVAGYRHVTASFGVNGFTSEMRDAFITHNVKRVLIAYDRDEAGDRAAEDLAPVLSDIGIDCYRVLFPKGQDANDYARNVRPANKSLGTLLRSAEWISSGKKQHGAPAIEEVQAPEPVVPVKTVEETPPTEEAPAPVTPAALASPAPPPATRDEDDTVICDHEVTFKFGDRTWRVRGLAKNMSFETLRVNLLTRRGEDFHVDGLDLYNAKHRMAFIAQAAAELSVTPEVAKRDMGRVLLKLEALQDAQITQALSPADRMPAMPSEDRTAALKLLKQPDLLERIADNAESCGIVGERANVLAAYLACVSRKLDRPLAVMIQSTSAAGKSALMDAVLALMPEEECVQYSAMTGQSLYYLGESDIKHKVLAIAEEEGVREASYALKLLQSQGGLTIASTGKDALTGKLVTQEYKVTGPVTLMLTTTAIDLDEELKNRCLVLTINESRDQTREIHRRQRYEETLDGLIADERRAAIIALHQNAQRLLRPLKVVNPYAEHLTFLDEKTRMRRDHKKYLTLIRAIALLHQHQRPVKTLNPDGADPIDYIEVTLDDIAAANTLCAEVMGRTLDELPPQTRTLLGLIRDMAEACAKEQDTPLSEVRFTRRDIRTATGWGDTQAKVHCRRLVELEYLIVHRGGHAQQYLYELAYDGAGDDGAPFLMGLIDCDTLEQAANRAGSKSDPSGSGGGGAGSGRASGGPSAAGGQVNKNDNTQDAATLWRGTHAVTLKPHVIGSAQKLAPYAQIRIIG